MTPVDRCPFCGIDLRETWSDGRTGYRTIGVELPGVYDGTLFWMCPVCEGTWHAWSDGHRLHDFAEEFVGPGPKMRAAMDAWHAENLPGILARCDEPAVFDDLDKLRQRLNNLSTERQTPHA